MLAYAFLANGAVALPSGFQWPTAEGDGAWVEAGRDTEAAVVRGLRVADLPYWLDEELWQVELGGSVTEARHMLLAERARLDRRVESWTDEVAWGLVQACAFRVRDRSVEGLRGAGRDDSAEELTVCSDLAALEECGNAIAARDTSEAARLAGFAADVVSYAREAGRGSEAAGVAAYIAAHALAGGDKAAGGYDRRFEDERAWQSEWLRERLAL